MPFVGIIQKKYKKWELKLFIFDEDRIICDIEYILDKKVSNKIHIANEGDDDRDEEASDSDEEASESQSNDLSNSEKISLPMLMPLMKTLSKIKQNK